MNTSLYQSQIPESLAGYTYERGLWTTPVRPVSQIGRVLTHFAGDSDDLVLFDLDGVLADDRPRQALALDHKWDEYFALIPHDKPWAQGRDIYTAAVIAGSDIGYLTGRRYRHGDITRAWLDQYGYATDVPLIMRREYLDTAPLATFKRNIIEDLAIDGSWKSITLYEDDDRVIESVNGLGTVKGCRVRAVHCTWAKKPRRMMSKGVA